MQYLSGDGNLIFRPFASQVNTDAGHNSWGVAQAHGRQMQGICCHEVGCLCQLLGCWNKRNENALRPTIALSYIAPTLVK